MTEECPVDVLRDLLSLVLQQVPSLEMIESWDPKTRWEAEEWATREHLAASDNPVKRISKPSCLKDYT
jgi:hypothetical protein